MPGLPKPIRHLLAAWLIGWATWVAAAPPAAEIVVAVPSGVEMQGLQAAILDYRRERQIPIHIAYVQRDELHAAVTRRAALELGGYDIVLLDDPWLPFFVENGFLEELTPYFEATGAEGPDADFLAKSLALCRHPYGAGPYFCLPYVGNAQMFFYDRKLFASHGLEGEPDRWADVYPVMESITRAGAGRKFGFVLRGRASNPVVAQFMPILWASGGRILDDGGEPRLDTPEAVAALELFLDLARVAPPGAHQLDDRELAIYLRHGVAASSINWPAWAATFEDPHSSRVMGRMAYSVVPGGVRPGSGAIGHWLLGIMKGSRNKQAAFEFITWATSPERMRRSALAGNPPVRSSTFNDPELLARPAFRHYPTLLRAIRTSSPRPRHPRWTEIELALGPVLSEAVAGKLDAESAMARAQAAVAGVLAQ